LILFNRNKERGKELKVPYHARATSVRDGNMPGVTAACLIPDNTRAETYIAKLINTVSREATPLSFSKRTIIYATDIGETHTLNLSKVQYLLNYSINISRARKLLGRGNI